jgi:hypothetical protein
MSAAPSSSRRDKILGARARAYDQQMYTSTKYPIVIGAYNELHANYGEIPKKPSSWNDHLYGPYPPLNISIYVNHGIYGFIIDAIICHRKMIKKFDELYATIDDKHTQYRTKLYRQDEFYLNQLHTQDDYYRVELNAKMMEIKQLHDTIAMMR